MNAEYLHCSSGWSYWIDCDVIEKRACNMNDATQLDRILRQPPNNLGRDGYVIRYTDDYETVIKWVPKAYVRTPDISDWIGL